VFSTGRRACNSEADRFLYNVFATFKLFLPMPFAVLEERESQHNEGCFCVIYIVRFWLIFKLFLAHALYILHL